jgi:hypothetical protein
MCERALKSNAAIARSEQLRGRNMKRVTAQLFAAGY